MYRKLTSKGRKDALASQLPLASGRQVAFRQPIKVGSPEEWILARIVTCIQGDKNR
jgi:SAGA-associated factor 29